MKSSELPPLELYNPEAEQQVIGMLLLHNDLATAVPLDPDWCFDPLHHKIVKAILRRIEAGDLASPITLQAEFRDDEGLKELGGTGYLARMAGSSLAPVTFKHYAQMLRDLWARRSMSRVLREGAEQIERIGEGDSPSQTISRVEGEIAAIASVASHRPLVRSWLSASHSAILQINASFQSGGVIGTPTGFKSMDDQIGGMAPGDMIVLAGRPSMGKTAIALGIAWSVMEQGLPVFFGSLEMPAEQLMHRWFSSKLKQRGHEVPYFNIRTGRLAEAEFRDILMLAREFETNPMHFGERECRSMPRLRSAARRAEQIAGKPLGLIVIDYLQLLDDPKSTSDYAKVSKASNDIKTLAMDMRCPVIALSQLSRGVESRDPPTPKLSDLRDSGKIEEDADLILLAYREAYYLTKALEATPKHQIDKITDLSEAILRCKNDVSLFIPKARGGATGKVDLRYWPEFNLIEA